MTDRMEDYSVEIDGKKYKLIKSEFEDTKRYVAEAAKTGTGLVKVWDSANKGWRWHFVKPTTSIELWEPKDGRQ